MATKQKPMTTTGGSKAKPLTPPFGGAKAPPMPSGGKMPTGKGGKGK